MTNSQWVICHLCQSLLFIWQTGCEWENILNNLNLSHHDQQEVCGTLLSSHITLLMAWATGSERNLTLCPNQSIKSHLIANRGWVMHLAHVSIKFHASTNVWQDVSVAATHSARYPYCVPQQIESESGSTYAPQTVSHFMRKRVSSTIVLDSRLILAHPMTDSKCVYCSFYSPTVISLHDQQSVSNTTSVSVAWHIWSTVCKYIILYIF